MLQMQLKRLGAVNSECGVDTHGTLLWYRWPRRSWLVAVAAVSGQVPG